MRLVVEMKEITDCGAGVITDSDGNKRIMLTFVSRSGTESGIVFNTEYSERGFVEMKSLFEFVAMLLEIMNDMYKRGDGSDVFLTSQHLQAVFGDSIKDAIDEEFLKIIRGLDDQKNKEGQ